jgi:hypothetical protein
VYTPESDSTRGRGTSPASRPDPARESDGDASTQMKLATTREGGFRIDPDGGTAPLAASPAGEGWEVLEQPEGRRWSLLRDRSYPGGFVLRDAGGGESGRTTREAGEDGPPSNLLAPDGRLFEIRRRGAREARFELSGWEVPGAYLVARSGEDGWEIARTDAGCALEVAPEVLILFAAEILDAAASDDRG